MKDKIFIPARRQNLWILISVIMIFVLFCFYSEAQSEPGWMKFLNAANTKIKNKNYQIAEMILNTGIQKYPRIGRLIYLRATLRANQLGKKYEALKDYTRVIRLRDQSCPECLKAWCYRGIEFYKLGQYKMALKDLSHSLKVVPHYNKARAYRAKTYARLGMIDQAVKDANLTIKNKDHSSLAKELLEKIMTGCTDF